MKCSPVQCTRKRPELSCYHRNSKTTARSEFFVHVSLPTLRKTVIMRSDISFRVSIDTTHTSSTNRLQSVSGSLRSRLSLAAPLQALLDKAPLLYRAQVFHPTASSTSAETSCRSTRHAQLSLHSGLFKTCSWIYMSCPCSNLTGCQSICTFVICYKGWLGVVLCALTFVEQGGLFCSITDNFSTLLAPFKQVGRFYLI